MSVSDNIIMMFVKLDDNIGKVFQWINFVMSQILHKKFSYDSCWVGEWKTNVPLIVKKWQH